MEDWGSVNRATFPSAHGVNGIDKSVIDADIKYPQVPYYKLVFYCLRCKLCSEIVWMTLDATGYLSCYCAITLCNIAYINRVSKM